jgi:hypothetical protein
VKTNHLFKSEEHRSYRLHRKQLGTQILLPVILVVLVFVGVLVLLGQAAFRPHDDVARWAAISTIWMVVPVLLAGIAVLALVCGLIFVVWKLAGWLPEYSYKAQIIAGRVERGTARFAEMGRKPILAVKGLGQMVKTAFGRRRERK